MKPTINYRLYLDFRAVCKTQHERPVELSSRLQELHSTSVKKKIPIAIGTKEYKKWDYTPIAIGAH